MKKAYSTPKMEMIEVEIPSILSASIPVGGSGRPKSMGLADDDILGED